MEKNKIITILCFLLISAITNAQSSHNLKPNSLCKFVKKAKYWDGEGASPCSSCTEDNKKNQAAVEMELKRRVAAGKIAEADKLRKIQQEYVKRNAEQKQKIETQSKNVVSFALQKKENTEAKKKEIKTEVTKPNLSKVKMNNVLYNSYAGYSDLSFYNSTNKLVNSSGDIVIERGTLYQDLRGASLKDTFLNFPPNCAIVSYIAINKFAYDIINTNGVRLFNDNSIHNIYHFFGPYFLIGYDQYATNQFMKVALYNLETKTFQWFSDNSAELDGRIAVVDIQYCQSSNVGQYDCGYKEFAKKRGIDKYILVSVYGNRRAMYYLDSKKTLQKFYTKCINKIVIEE